MTWTKVPDLEEMVDDDVRQVIVESKTIAFYRLDGAYFATDDMCTHARAHMSEGFVEEGCIECPLHGARFDIRTGQPMTPPARVALRCYPVKTEGRDVMIDI